MILNLFESDQNYRKFPTYLHIIKIFYFSPLQTLPNELFLFLFQRSGGNELVQLLVTVIYHELLETVVFEHLEPVQVQHA